MSCVEKITVNAKAVNWLKEKYPELCINAGLCERIGGRLYTKTFIDQSAPLPTQEPFTPDWDAMAVMVEEMQRMAKRIEELEEALAQPAQEPVGTFDVAVNERTAAINYDYRKHKLVSGTKLYTTPPKRDRVLFPTMLRKMWSGGEVQAWLDENVNKEKNNG